jgi:hypothetical protein
VAKTYWRYVEVSGKSGNKTKQSISTADILGRSTISQDCLEAKLINSRSCLVLKDHMGL